MAAIIVAGGQLDRQVNHPELFVHADLAPDACVAGVVGRVFLPGVVAEFSRTRNRVEYPKALAGADVESADVAFNVGLAAGHSARAVGGADDHRVPSHHWSSVQTDFARHGIDLLIIVLLEIDDSVLAEAGYRHAGFRVQRDQAISRRDVQDSFLTSV